MNVPTIEDVLLRAHVLIDTKIGTTETTKKSIYLGNKAMIVELLLHLTSRAGFQLDNQSVDFSEELLLDLFCLFVS